MHEGKRPPRRYNWCSHSFIKLRTPEVSSDRFRSHGEYCVARLLIELTRGPFPPRTGFTNNCGLPECVNPQHWTPQIPAPKWRFSVIGPRWQLVLFRTGEPAAASVVLRARDKAGVVHVFSVEPLTKRDDPAPPRALCGASFPPLELLVMDLPVTCTKGC